MNQLLEKLDLTPPGEKEKEKYFALQEQFARSLPFIPLYYAPQFFAVKKGLSGVKPCGFQPITWNVEEWERER